MLKKSYPRRKGAKRRKNPWKWEKRVVYHHLGVTPKCFQSPKSRLTLGENMVFITILKITFTKISWIKTCMYYPDSMISFENIRKMNNRAMPEAFMSYKLAIQLHKLYNVESPSLDWTTLNFDQILTSRQTNFLISKSNIHKVGMNILPNRFSVLNGKIPLLWLNYSLNRFKINVKKLLLTAWHWH